MAKIRRVSEFARLDCEVRTKGVGESIIDLFKFLRAKYVSQYQSDRISSLLRKLGVPMPTADSLPPEVVMRFTKIQKKHSLDWGNLDLHLRYRIKNTSDLMQVLPNLRDRKESIEKVRKRGFFLSILPTNLLLPEEVLENFLPPSDYFEPHPTKHTDPYGIFAKKSKVMDSETGLLLGSRRFKHSFLMNIHGLCPVGCSDCYKAYYTREEHELGVTLKTVPRQTNAVVNWLNENPEVYDVIVSGGEPLLATNSSIAGMLEILAKARHLKVLRICTGSLFLGLAMRIDDGLLDLLKDFSERTGITVRIHANLYNHFQFTPESVLAIHRIRKRGFSIYSQVPIKEGINFFSHDQRKTLDFLRKLGLAEVLAGVEPYKFIVDMHPRTNMYYVPIEPLIRVWFILAETHDHPEIERPKTLSVLFSEGNIILSGYLLFAAQKKIDRANNLVRYYIPVPFGRKRVFIYDEPLVESNCDPHSLERLKEKWFLTVAQKIRRSKKRA